MMPESDDDDGEGSYVNAEVFAAAKVESDVSGQSKGRAGSPSANPAAVSGVPRDPPRLLIISSKVKLASAIVNAALPNVTCVQFKYDACTLDGILAAVAQSLGNEQQVESMALILNCSGPVIYLCGKDEKVITKEVILESKSIREFLSTLVINHLDRSWVNARLDFLMCSAAVTIDGGIIAKEIEDMIGVPVGMSKDLYGTDIPYQRVGVELEESQTIGQLYFRIEKLRAWSSSNPQSLAGFEKIRLVGKGAYGTAVLYRKKDDDTLVILKEINMHDLNAGERQMALNEVKVLAMLEHPNIIGYYDSFEEDGVLMIEMEYADGGTLAQYLSSREQPLDEQEILEKFAQIVNALKHIHGHNVLHRDLKTANIFLTKDGIVKLGDFGISKMMTTGGKVANTVLGTPYYISPEICEGKAYGDKSDIWALGCILYEMACLQKTFEGSNLPALVNKIVNGQFAPVKGNYSNEFKELVQMMLDKNPQNRPSAVELCTKWLPPLLSRYEVIDPVAAAGNGLLSNGKRKTMSAIYYLETFNMSLHPIEMPTRIKIKEVAVSVSHAVVVTTEHMVYSWGDGSKGQLGHGDFEPRQVPQLVDALKGKSITKVCCGDKFSAFSCNNGIAMTCGDGSKGCLGHSDWQTLAKPKLVESLLHMDVMWLACGPHHVVAVGNKGAVYAWGKGADGRLGTGSDDDQFAPVKVAMPDDVFVTKAYCGVDGTMLLTDIGATWAFGNNRHNKLGLNNRQGFLASFKNAFSKTEVEVAKAPAIVRDLVRHKIVDISMGQNHTSVVAENGNVYTLGRNLEGQLGTGNAKEFNGLNHVKSLEKTRALKARCSDLYTAVCTVDGQLVFWGTKYTSPPSLDLSSSGDRVRGSILCIHSAGSVSSGGGNGSNLGVASIGRAEVEEVPVDVPSGETARSGSARASAQGTHVSVGSAGRHTTPSPAGFPDIERSEPANVTPSSKADDVHMDWELARGGVTSASSPGAPESFVPKKGDDTAAATGTASRRPLSGPLKRSPTSGKDKAQNDRPIGGSGTAAMSASALDDCTAYFQPTPLLHMNSERTESVMLSDFVCHGENMLLLVETTAPPAGRRLRKRKSLQSVVVGRGGARDGSSASSSSQQPVANLHDGRAGNSSAAPTRDSSSGVSAELDSLGPAASWIQRELHENEIVRPSGSDGSARAERVAHGNAAAAASQQHQQRSNNRLRQQHHLQQEQLRGASAAQSLNEGDLESIADVFHENVDDDHEGDDDEEDDSDEDGDNDLGSSETDSEEDDVAAHGASSGAEQQQHQPPPPPLLRRRENAASAEASKRRRPPQPLLAFQPPAAGRQEAATAMLSSPPPLLPHPIAAAAAVSASTTDRQAGGQRSGGSDVIRTIDDLASTPSGSPEHASSLTAERRTAAVAARPEGLLQGAAAANRHPKEGSSSSGGGGSSPHIVHVPQPPPATAASKFVIAPGTARHHSPKQRKQPTPTPTAAAAAGHGADAERHPAAGSSGSSSTESALSRLNATTASASSDDGFRVLMEQLMEERRLQEQRMKEMEERHREREQHIRAEAQRAVAERERMMQEELKKLKDELAAQHQQMLLLLQQQLVVRTLGPEERTAPPAVLEQQRLQQPIQKQPSAADTKVSRVCSLQ